MPDKVNCPNCNKEYNVVPNTGKFNCGCGYTLSVTWKADYLEKEIDGETYSKRVTTYDVDYANKCRKCNHELLYTKKQHYNTICTECGTLNFINKNECSIMINDIEYAFKYTYHRDPSDYNDGDSDDVFIIELYLIDGNKHNSTLIYTNNEDYSDVIAFSDGLLNNECSIDIYNIVDKTIKLLIEDKLIFVNGGIIKKEDDGSLSVYSDCYDHNKEGK